MCRERVRENHQKKQSRAARANEQNSKRRYYVDRQTKNSMGGRRGAQATVRPLCLIFQSDPETVSGFSAEFGKGAEASPRQFGFDNTTQPTWETAAA